MQRGYIELTQELVKSLLGDHLPKDARMYGFDIDPKTAAVRIYFFSDEAPDVPEYIASPFYYSSAAREISTKKRKQE